MDLIERAALLVALDYGRTHNIGVRQIVNDAPTVEAEPVVRARWKQIGLWDVACGNCGKSGSGHWLRCPHCEAKMDGFDESVECKAMLDGARMDADAPERADHIGEVTEMVGKDGRE